MILIIKYCELGLETKMRMNDQGQKSIPFQLDPLDKSDPAQMFRGAYGVPQSIWKHFGDYEILEEL